MKASFDGPFRYPQYGCRVFDAQILNVSQDHNVSIGGTKRINCILQCLARLVLFEQFGRYRAPIRKVSWPIVAFRFLVMLIEGLIKVTTILPQPHPRFVISDLHEPGAELAFRTEA